MSMVVRDSWQRLKRVEQNRGELIYRANCAVACTDARSRRGMESYFAGETVLTEVVLTAQFRDETSVDLW